ncbi:hypothetical protein CHS0354_002348 [Potamilus streckersoni]|uniref:Amine oxidase n=1 Tax=Potamilus streckersoni TaxID=2493646 RepID=A0AAE0VZU0_9BIVA|nr:hypothetical protein CHS0354_002348 [Potamilus streckersoni]
MANKKFDVIVIGAGISGLTAAYSLLQKDPNLSVLVLEAKDRVGGRTLTVDLKTKNGNDRWDLGGQWVGRCQSHIMALLKELGLETYPQYITGIKFMQLGDNKVRTYLSDIPSLSLGALLDLHMFLRKVEILYKEVNIRDPYACRHGASWDSMTFATFLHDNMWTQGAKETVEAATRCMLGMETSQFSVLYYLMYLAAAGGLKNLVEAKDSAAQEFRIKDGAQGVSKALSDKIGHDKIHLGKPVAAVQQTGDGVLITTVSGEKYQSSKLILSTPPPQTEKIHFDPPLPLSKREFIKRMPFSSMIKVIITYEQTFWRQAGQSGEVVTNGGESTSIECDKGPLCVVYDGTTCRGSPALIGFIGGQQAIQWGQQEAYHRRSAVLKSLSEFFGDQVFKYIDYREKNWNEEPYTEGGPVCCVGPGAMRNFNSGLRNQFDRIHFAGTESAMVWCGYMSGAVQAGKRAAVEILYDLRPQLVSRGDLASLENPFRQPQTSSGNKRPVSHAICSWTLGLGILAVIAVVAKKFFIKSGV